MIKSYLKKVVLSVAILSTSLVANSSEYIYNTHSLVGIEGGYSKLDVETNAASEYDKIKDNFGHAGLKIGAQSENYRIFLSARYYAHSDFDYFNTYGVEAQYLFNMAKFANFYVGINAGIANAKYYIDGEADARTISDSYFGGDLGFNFHVIDSLDIEVGARVIDMNALNTKDDISYRFNTIVSGYASLIFRYKMD